MEQFLRLKAFVVTANSILDYDYKTKKFIERDLMSAPTVNHNIINDALIKGFNSDYGQTLLITECQANGFIYKNKQYVNSYYLLETLEKDTLILINKALFDKL